MTCIHESNLVNWFVNSEAQNHMNLIQIPEIGKIFVSQVAGHLFISIHIILVSLTLNLKIDFHKNDFQNLLINSSPYPCWHLMYLLNFMSKYFPLPISKTFLHLSRFEAYCSTSNVSQLSPTSFAKTLVFLYSIQNTLSLVTWKLSFLSFITSFFSI